MKAPGIFTSVPLFQSLKQAEMEHLASVAVTKSYQAGEHLFLEGDECKGIWIVTAGSVKIVKMAPSGRQIVLAVQQAPATVAEVPVFDGGPYPATVTAMAPSEALCILKDDFLQVCRNNPQLALNFLAVFGGRLRHLVGLVERITFGSVRQRLATELLGFAEASGGDRFVLSETHEELATRLGTVREVVSRNLGRFQGEGMLRVDRREIEILDRAALIAEANTEL
jgi:CRP/FNR family transcriptional regulator